MTTPANGSYLSEKQVNLLLQPINTRRVRVLKGNSYVQGHDIRAELNRVFGFGRWDMEVVEQALIREHFPVKTSTGSDAWHVVYKSRVRLTVKAPDGTALSVQEATHVGESMVPSFGDAHGNAITNSETYALRRCCINFGDQFGLSLYNKGQTDAMVRWTMVRPDVAEVDTEDVPEVYEESATQGEESMRPAADLSGFKTRAAAADDGDALDLILADAEQLRADEHLTVEELAQARSIIATRAADLDRQSRQPAAGSDESVFVARFTMRLGEAKPGAVRGMLAEVGRAVASKTITPDTGTSLSAMVRERIAKLEGARDDVA